MGSLKYRSLALFVSVSMVSIPSVSYADAAREDGHKGAHYDAEWRTLPALADDYEVVQLTTSDALDNKMYLDVDPYVPALNSIVFMSDRQQKGKKQNLYLMSLDNGSFVQLTDADDMDGDHANVSPETKEAFFREGHTIKQVSLESPYDEKEIYTADRKYDIKGIVALTSDGRTMALSLYDDKKKKSTLVTVDVDSGRQKEIRKVDNTVDHLLINPNGSKLLYHVLDKDIIGLVDVDTGNQNILTDSDEHGVHPFWSANGRDAAYAQRAKGDSDEKVVNYDTDTGQYIKYKIDKHSNHFAMNPDQTLIEGDGSSTDKDNRFIYYYKVKQGDTTTETTKMFEHGSSSDSEQVHPHAAFINNTDAVFNSDRAGSGDVYLLRKKH